MKPNEVARIYFCPRFHVSFYHSYRGDTADELGFGKDIRIIRGILDDLEKLGGEGITVHCAWDVDNVFTLGQMLPQHAPDILRRIQNRVTSGLDEMHLMSWNNGLLSAHTPEEFKLAIGWALKAADGSGNLDVFKTCANIVRPQECMVSPSHLALYKQLGIDTLSIYYSAIPFNGFGSFLPGLPVEQRYNPLLLQDKETGVSMRLLPAINQGDLAEYGLSARRMLNIIRREQIKLANPTDLIVLLDMDADDTFWEGFLPPSLGFAVPSFAGLYRLIKSTSSLPFVSFIKPSGYLATHAHTGTIKVSQDLADGAFDGYASWAEKYENHALWTQVTEARNYWDAAKKTVIAETKLPPSAEHDFNQWSSVLPDKLHTLAIQAISTRLRVLSTTHFGLSAPVMNVHRLTIAAELAAKAITQAQLLLKTIESYYPSSVVLHAYTKEASWAGPILEVEAHSDGSMLAKIRHPDTLQTLVIKTPWIEYGNTIHKSTHIHRNASETEGKISLDSTGQAMVEWSQSFTMNEQTHTLRVDCSIKYPATPHQRYGKVKAGRLQRTWDARWKQIAPMELVIFTALPLSRTITVWKQDFGGHISSYPLDYYRYGGNNGLESINNHVTPSWLALSDGSNGVLIAQSRKSLHGFAFCPLRQTIRGGKQAITANPFGTYWGKQYRYPAAVTGWGRQAALLTAEHLYPSAPSWEGKQVHFCLIIAPYQGNRPPRELETLAECFSETGACP